MNQEPCLYPDLYVRFLYEFHETRDYFECHELLEDLWMEEAREPFYQGLLQIAVGLFHHRNENIGGARKMFDLALQKLAYYPNHWMGIDVRQTRQKVSIVKEKMEQDPSVPFEPMEIVILDKVLQELVHQLKTK
ncbi:hypothetical protein SAMN04487866_10233 [Thermoactinomyces sp. DSM 45891]|uniref:DUF309 domain-containing protein n=1 Tax=Thermoactinomyces sp. DSM 45891 TaxID=1761907 RepID=UPI000916573A|nr:DUF309 domain-containing protein [Thermoactinomyces sp. DSM 45891]SFX17980.1 hypothetical protein SAMN04487866_10233 [Thermoactinomyces sp. DSM 45891]